MPSRFKAILATTLVPATGLAAASATNPPSASNVPGAAWLLAFAALATLALGWHRRQIGRLAQRQRDLEIRGERLRHVLEACEDGLWDWDLETGRIERSERWATMLGYAPHEIEPTIAAGAALVHPDDLMLYQSWQTRLVAGTADRHSLEYRMKARGGEWRWVLDRGKVVARASDGRPTRMAGTHTDITKSKSTEIALTESQTLLKRSAQLLQQTQSAARVGGWETDLRTGRVFWTSETYRIHETTPEEYHPTRDTLFQFYVPESRGLLIAAAERAIRDGTGYGLDLELVTTKHRRIHVHTTGVAEWDGDRIVKLYGSFRDITAEKVVEHEREKLQRKMVETQKLESLGVLAGGVAHDFNNLLTVILANADLIRREPVGDPRRIEHVEAAARRAADLCRQMLAYAGKAAFVVERVDLTTLVEDTLQLLHGSLGGKTRLELALAGSLPAAAGDLSQLRQVVMNLALNAAEALEGGNGKVRITTSIGTLMPLHGGVLHSFDLPPGDAACLEVSDTGVGMSAETLERIFDPFFTTKFAGRGLGLAAVLGIVRTHRGALAVESKPGRGSVFRLYLPLARRAEPAPATKSARPTLASSGAILVADDEAAVRDVVAVLLRRLGFEVITVSDGMEAVARFRERPEKFRAVLLDLTMPGLDGGEAAHAIRETSPAMPLFVMSGFSEQDVLARVRDLANVSVLQKPLTHEALAAHFRELASTADR